MIDDDLLTLLRGADTPTVCNAIEVVQGKRGFAGFTRGTMLASHPTAPAMVGYAVTAKISGLAPPSEPASVIRARRMDYYRMMAEAPRPAVAVIDDVEFPGCVGAYWGEINTEGSQGPRSRRRADQRGDARPRQSAGGLPGGRRLGRSEPRLRPRDRERHPGAPPSPRPT
jgi:hypothetical protein